MRPSSGDDSGEAVAPDALVWRGVAPPPSSGAPGESQGGDEWSFDDGFDDGYDDDEPVRRRSGLRLMAVLGAIGFAFAATVVTGSSGSDDESPVPSTTVLLDNAGGDDADLDAQDPNEPIDPAEPLVADRPDVDLGLSYGGAGGGADIREVRPISPLSAEPLLDPDVLPRLPDRIDTVVWSVTVPAADLDLRGDEPTIGVTVVDEVVAVSAARRAGGSTTESNGDDRRAVVLLDIADGSFVSDTLAVPADVEALDASLDAQLARRAVATNDINPDALVARTISASPVADELTKRAIEQLDAGEASVLAAEEVAQGRAVAFIGDRLIGLRAAGGDGVTSDSGSPLIADWTRAGVLVGVAASDRGALLLVSDLRGRQQMTIDAATGETVAELSVLARTDVYAPAANGLVVRRPAAIGSVIEAVDLDGRPLWQLIGAPAWTLGDGLIVTVSFDTSGLTVEARR